MFKDVIIIDEMGVNFGATKRDPIVIDDEPQSSPHVDEEIPVISDEDEAAHGSSTSNFFDDDLSFVNQFKTKKKSENEKLFEKSIHLLKRAENKKAEKKSSRKSPPKLNAEFEAEIRRKKEKMAEEKLAKAAKEAREDELREERLKKLKAERIKKNSALFDQFSRSESEKRKTSKKSEKVRDDFLDEVRRKATLAKEKTAKEKAKNAAEAEPPKPEQTKAEPPKPEQTKAEPPKSAERIKLDQIAANKTVKELDKMDLKLLFSQKW